MIILGYAAYALGALAISMIVEGCASDPQTADPNDKSQWKREDYQKAQAELQQKLRTAPTDFKTPPQERVEKFCFAQYGSNPSGYNGVRATIRSQYSYHPAQICRNPNEAANPQTIDFSKVPTGSVVLKLAALSIVNVGGDQAKGLDIESVAGRLLLSAQPLAASNLDEAQRVCPSYSPLQPKSWDGDKIPIARQSLKYVADYPYFSENHSLIDDYSKLIDQLTENTTAFVKFNGRTIPTDQEMNFLLATKDGRYWGACKSGVVEAEATPVGAQYTHDLNSSLFGFYDENNSFPQCEVGGWSQVYEYENRPIVALDGTAEGFRIDTQYVCIRGLETDPHPLIQGAIDVARLVQEGEVTLGHDSLDPRNIILVYGLAGRRLHNETLYAVTIKAEKR